MLLRMSEYVVRLISPSSRSRTSETPTNSTAISDAYLDKSSRDLVVALSGQSLIKHLLTAGDMIVVARTSPLEDQGGYAVASNYGEPSRYGYLRSRGFLREHSAIPETEETWRTASYSFACRKDRLSTSRGILPPILLQIVRRLQHLTLSNGLSLPPPYVPHQDLALPFTPHSDVHTTTPTPTPSLPPPLKIPLHFRSIHSTRLPSSLSPNNVSQRYTGSFLRSYNHRRRINVSKWSNDRLFRSFRWHDLEFLFL